MAEATGVHKQTTETLMAGEKIIEALDLADAERTAFGLWEADKANLSAAEAAKLPPPQRNTVLSAYDAEPEEWVLRVVEKIPNAALLDALLVLPFGKVMSLMHYLDEWARKVSVFSRICFCYRHSELTQPGMECRADMSHHLLPPEDAPSPDRRESRHAHCAHPVAKAFAVRAHEAKADHGVRLHFRLIVLG